jgi:hypothetical protein
MHKTIFFFLAIFIACFAQAMEKSNLEKTECLTAERVHNCLRIFTENFLKKRAQESKADDTIRYFFSNKNNHLQNIVTHTSFDTTEQAELAIKELCAKDKRMVWWVTPFTRPENMGELLQKNNFHPNPMAAMGCLLSDVNIEKLEAILKSYADKIQIDAKSSPTDIKKYELYYENSLASSCSIFTQENWAAIFNLSTNENMQRKGLATALFAFILNDLKNNKYHAAYMVSVPMSVIIGTKLGFKRFGNINYFYRLESSL